MIEKYAPEKDKEGKFEVAVLSHFFVFSSGAQRSQEKDLRQTKVRVREVFHGEVR